MLAVLAVLVGATVVSAQTVTLAWNPNSESDLAGYRIQYGTQSGNPATTLDVGTATSRQITGLQAGATYYFRVVAYGESGLTSVPSAEVSYVVPGTPPPAPTLASVSPIGGPTSGGTLITLSGSNFVSGATVRVGGVAATGVTFVGSTQVLATTPAGSAGARTVELINPDGRTASLTGAYTYTTSSTLPTITSVSPAGGPTAGGTTITITGANYVLGAGGEIRVGGVPCTGIAYISSTQLRAVTPAGVAGPQAVSVRNPNGDSVTLPGGFTYTAPVPAPTLTAVSPASGPTAGGTTVTLTGTNFVSGATVRVGGVAATGVTFVSATQLRATAPASTAGAKSVQVTNPDGQSATLGSGYTYTTTTTTAPTLTSVSPSSGPIQGGTAITLIGTNFVRGSGGEIRIGDVLARNIRYVSSTRLTATTRAGTAGPTTVTVRNPDGQIATLANGFTYTTSAGAAATEQTAAARATTYDSLLAEDADGDGLPTAWEDSFGLDATSADGENGAEGDPDADGITNASELAAGSHPRGTVRRYLAEGVVATGMTTRLALANPELANAHVLLTFADDRGHATRVPLLVPARSRRTIDLATVRELAGRSFATTLEADGRVAVDRLVAWGGASPGATVAPAVEQPSSRWLLEHATTTDPAELYYLVQNTGATRAELRVRYLTADGAAPIERAYSVAAEGRTTIWVDRETAALGAGRVAAEIVSVNGTPLVVEQTQYVVPPGGSLPVAGTTRAGRVGLVGDAAVESLEPAPGRVFAQGDQEGLGGTALAVALTNRGPAAAQIRVTLLFEDGPESTAAFTVEAGARFVLPIEDAFPAAAGQRFSIVIEGGDAQAVLAERAIP